jgi:uncharacterized protein (TIGR02391 family)
MTPTPRNEEAINVVVKQLEELDDIATSAKSSRDALLGFEKLNRWKARTVRLLSENIHPNEGQKLQDKPTYSFRTFGIALENLLEAVSIYSGFLESLLEELKGHPEDVLDVPIPSDDRDKTMKAPKPIYLFDSMQFHPKIAEASRKLFEDGHYRDAILRALVEVNNFVKTKTGLELDGKALMSQAFRIDNPVIRLNELKTQSERDEQEGFMFLFMGAMVGIRNPKAHDNIIQTDPLRTLEYLALASLLMKRAEEGVCQIK